MAVAGHWSFSHAGSGLMAATSLSHPLLRPNAALVAFFSAVRVHGELASATLAVVVLGFNRMFGHLVASGLNASSR